MTIPMSMDSRHDITQCIQVLLPQGGNCGQDVFCMTGAVIALVDEASLRNCRGAPPGSLERYAETISDDLALGCLIEACSVSK